MSGGAHSSEKRFPNVTLAAEYAPLPQAGAARPPRSARQRYQPSGRLPHFPQSVFVHTGRPATQRLRSTLECKEREGSQRFLEARLDTPPQPVRPSRSLHSFRADRLISGPAFRLRAGSSRLGRLFAQGGTGFGRRRDDFVEQPVPCRRALPLAPPIVVHQLLHVVAASARQGFPVTMDVGNNHVGVHGSSFQQFRR